MIKVKFIPMVIETIYQNRIEYIYYYPPSWNLCLSRFLKYVKSDLMPCSFCQRITNNKNLIWHDDRVAVILDIDPISKGHVLIVPIKHYVDMDELPIKLLSHIMHIAQTYVKVLKQVYQPAGYSIMQNGGKFNELDHFHLHVFQRNNPKEFSWTYTETMEADKLFDSIRNEVKPTLIKEIGLE